MNYLRNALFLQSNFCLFATLFHLLSIMKPSEVLKQHKIKKTAPRVAIIQVLKRYNHPLSENEIRNEMGSLYDRVTFYRSMQRMAEVGILHKIVVDNVTIKYALNDCSQNACDHNSHAHFFCKKCSKLICLGAFKTRVVLPNGCVGEESELLVKGICSNCSLQN